MMTPNWNLVEDTLERLMTEDGSFEKRVPNRDQVAIQSKYGVLVMRTESSFAQADNDETGALALKLLFFGNHPDHGTVAVPVTFTDYGTFEECIERSVTSNFHLHYLAVAGAMTSSPHTCLFNFAMKNGDAIVPWMAHTGLLSLAEENQEQLYALIGDLGLEEQLMANIAPRMPQEPFQRCYFSATRSDDGSTEGSVLFNDTTIEEASALLGQACGKLFAPVSGPASFNRFVLFTPGEPATE